MGKSVAETILEQMGGYNKLRAMVGAHSFVGGSDCLRFGYAGKVKRCIIILTPDDLYTMRLWEIRKGGLDCKLVYEQERLFADSLREVFEAQTGLVLSL